MAAFRILGQFTQFFLDSGQVNAGGSITTYDTDLTTPKLTYSDPELSVPNPFIIPLDAAGRNEVDVWGDGAYGAIMKDALGTTIQTLNNIQSDSPVVDQIPALVAGQYLTNNGSVLLWGAILQVPDPTGLANYTLTSDGDNAVWTPPADAPDQTTITINTNEVSFSDGTNTFSTQYGTSSAPASGNRNTQVAVVYPKAFTTAKGAPKITQTNDGVTSNGSVPTQTVTAYSVTGFTVRFNIFDDDSNPPWDIIDPVTFAWEASGVYPTP